MGLEKYSIKMHKAVYSGKDSLKNITGILKSSGNDSLILDALIYGGQGAIAGYANVYPHVLASIYDLFVEDKLEEARVAQDSIASFRAVFKYGNPSTIVKKAVNLWVIQLVNVKHHLMDYVKKAMKH